MGGEAEEEFDDCNFKDTVCKLLHCVVIIYAILATCVIECTRYFPRCDVREEYFKFGCEWLEPWRYMADTWSIVVVVVILYYPLAVWIEWRRQRNSL